jgi:hypothetical protein
MMVAFHSKTVPEAPRLRRLYQRSRANQKGRERRNDDFPHRYPSFILLSWSDNDVSVPPNPD